MQKQKILQQYQPVKSNLLLILHDLQDNNPQNYITKKDMQDVAEYLNITYSSVYGVATYYSMFSIKARGRYIIHVCNSPVCNMLQSQSIIQKLKDYLSIKEGETTKDGLFTLEIVECLGQCATAPAMVINRKIYDKLSEKKIEKIITALKNK